jgi:hypothetical protein
MPGAIRKRASAHLDVVVNDHFAPLHAFNDEQLGELAFP